MKYPYTVYVFLVTEPALTLQARGLAVAHACTCIIFYCERFKFTFDLELKFRPRAFPGLTLFFPVCVMRLLLAGSGVRKVLEYLDVLIMKSCQGILRCGFRCECRFPFLETSPLVMEYFTVDTGRPEFPIQHLVGKQKIDDDKASLFLIRRE